MSDDSTRSGHGGDGGNGDDGDSGAVVEDIYADDEDNELLEVSVETSGGRRQRARNPQRDRFMGEIIAGRWKLIEPISNQGGMGYLYEAEHLKLGKPCAIKLMPEEFGGEAARRRFEREARVTAKLAAESEFIVTVDDYAEHNGVPYYVMPKLSGHTLGAQLELQGAMTLSEASDMLSMILQGVSTAHKHGVIHRDLKPDNIFLDEKDHRLRPRIIDFGIAKVFGRPTKTVTETAGTLGTTHYKPPEYYWDLPPEPSPRIDVFALGLIAYEMLLGRHPWDEVQPDDIVARYQSNTRLPPLHAVPELQEAAIPRAFSKVIERALAYEPQDRFEDATQMLRALEATRRFDPKALAGGRLKGRYQLGKKLGAGGFGVVYRATDLRPGHRTVAIKFAAPPPALNEEERLEMFSRFDTECDALRSAEHPHVVAFLDKDREEGFPYCVMEYVEGFDFASYAIAAWQRPDGWSRILDILNQVADALDHAHQQGVIHRDVKPSNIVIDKETGEAKLIDFGIARADEGWHTKTGQAMGTPGYSAPEQLGGEHFGAVPQSDQWSLAALLYHMLTNMHPGEDSPGDKRSPKLLQAAVLNKQIIDLSAIRPPAEIPTELAAAIMRGLAYSPSERFSSCRELIAAVRATSEGHAIVPRAGTEAPTPIERPVAAAVDTEPSANGPARRRWAWPIVALGVAAGSAGIVWLAITLMRGDNSPTRNEPQTAVVVSEPDAGIEHQAPSAAGKPPDASPAHPVVVDLVTREGGKPESGVAVRVDGDRRVTPVTIERSVGTEVVVEVIDERYRPANHTCNVEDNQTRCEIHVRRRRRSGKPSSKTKEPTAKRRSLIRHVSPEDNTAKDEPVDSDSPRRRLEDKVDDVTEDEP